MYELKVVVEDDTAILVSIAFKEFLDGDSFSAYFEVTDIPSGEFVNINFSKVNSIHTNPENG
jgi:hypothetical protein